MLCPFKGRFVVTSPRGNRVLNGVSEYHKGIDLVGLDDDTVYAIADGDCRVLSEPNGFGTYIRQTLADGRRIYYAHLRYAIIEDRLFVRKGDKIGVMGMTGKVTGKHTHLELRPYGTSSDSLDISAFTGIPNKEGEYTTIVSKDETVQNLVEDGITSGENVAYWENVLSGKTKCNPVFLRTILNRYHQEG